jgi:hypothetical protein
MGTISANIPPRQTKKPINFALSNFDGIVDGTPQMLPEMAVVVHRGHQLVIHAGHAILQIAEGGVNTGILSRRESNVFNMSYGLWTMRPIFLLNRTIVVVKR